MKLADCLYNQMIPKIMLLHVNINQISKTKVTQCKRNIIVNEKQKCIHVHCKLNGCIHVFAKYIIISTCITDATILVLNFHA